MSSDYKCVVVGDKDAETTALLTCYTTNTFPEEYMPTVFEVTSVPITSNNTNSKLSLWDTANQDDYPRLRQLAYDNADVFIVCFSVDSPTSFANVKTKWFDDITNLAPGVPFIILGNNTERRQEAAASIATEQGIALAKELHAQCYRECSIRLGQGVQEVFAEAAECAVNYRKKREEGKEIKKKCVIM